MDDAKKFKRWITKEVLPSIRKNGRYELNHKPFKIFKLNLTYIKRLSILLEIIIQKHFLLQL